MNSLQSPAVGPRADVNSVSFGLSGFPRNAFEYSITHLEMRGNSSAIRQGRSVITRGGANFAFGKSRGLHEPLRIHIDGDMAPRHAGAFCMREGGAQCGVQRFARGRLQNQMEAIHTLDARNRRRTRA